jgi:hypothetical protein
MFSTTSDGWDPWLSASSGHQVIMGMDLIPQSISANKDPLTWEQPCAAGSYDHYATTLAQNLVSYSADSIVIRLGVEANGTWEVDYIGSTATEVSDWAKCYDNVVTAMRAVSGMRFLFVWNPNACTDNLPLNKWYPGNSYVDIMGIDAYDQTVQRKRRYPRKDGQLIRRTAPRAPQMIPISPVSQIWRHSPKPTESC